ncbi:hypothetical protein NDU88_005825 [Pleurodeles waltl]|uniref:Uncharacterized protein n=1 Tax=Pleurodeles waltl TaxID=8319 RepID=A0AAV7NWD1_PLEWA|nr:hypothetical protein NDU88_005825 [Pleurodeles waltl]
MAQPNTDRGKEQLRATPGGGRAAVGTRQWATPTAHDPAPHMLSPSPKPFLPWRALLTRRGASYLVHLPLPGGTEGHNPGHPQAERRGAKPLTLRRGGVGTMPPPRPDRGGGMQPRERNDLTATAQHRQ